MYVLCMWLVCVNIRIVSGTVIYIMYTTILCSVSVDQRP